MAVLRVLDVVLLRHDDGLDVFHGQVIAERLVKETLQLVHGELLHVALWKKRDFFLLREEADIYKEVFASEAVFDCFGVSLI